MYQIFEVTSNVNGEQRSEKAMITYADGMDLYSVLHKLGLEYALTPDGLRKYGSTGLSYNEILSRLTPEMLEPYDMTIMWLDREGFYSSDCLLITCYELQSHQAAMVRDNIRVAKTREVAERYARNLGHLKDNGHQLISSWDTTRIAERAASWACQFVRSDDPDPGKFFEKKLDYAAFRAGLSLQNVDGTDEQSMSQNADSTDEQNIPQNAVGDDGQNTPQAS